MTERMAMNTIGLMFLGVGMWASMKGDKSAFQLCIVVANMWIISAWYKK